MNRISFAIHHLNPWGGHDRSTLEISRRLSHLWGIDVFAYELIDPKLNEWGDLRFQQFRPNIRRPVVLTIFYYYLLSFYHFIFKPFLLLRKFPFVHSTGTCSIRSDLVHVQFVSATWSDFRRENRYFPEKDMSFAKHIYHEILLKFNVLMEYFLYSKKKTYIAISHSISEELQKYFNIPKEKIHVVHHGSDIEEFRPFNEREVVERDKERREFGFSKEDFVFIFVGEYERKGLAASLHALAKTKNKAIKLLAIGSGNVPRFERIISELNLEDRVTLVGSQKQIAKFYRLADAFLLPTYYEPFGLVIMEALSSGLPCVVSKLAGGAELIKSRDLLIDEPWNSDEISLKIDQLSSDRELAKNLSIESRTIAENQSWEKVASRFETIIEGMFKNLDS